MNTPGGVSEHAKTTPKTNSDLVKYTLNYAVANGVTQEQIQRATGIDEEALFGGGRRIPERIVPRLWQLVKEAYPTGAHTVEMAQATPFSFFGALLQGLEYAPTVRKALNTAVRNCKVFSDSSHHSLTETQTEARLGFFHPMQFADNGATSEVGIALYLRWFREILGLEEPVRRIEFAHGPNFPIAVYKDFLGVEVRFKQPGNAIILAREALDHRPPLADEQLYRFNLTRLELMRARVSKATVSAEMKQIFRTVAENAASGEYTSGALATRLNTNQRSLQRQLKEQGWEMRELLDKAREANAWHLLGDPEISLPAIADALGYSDDRAFRRAFQRWSGTTPAEFRKAKFESVQASG